MLSEPSVLEECSKDLEGQSQRLSWRIGEAFSHWFCSKIDLIILDQFDLRNSLSYLLTLNGILGLLVNSRQFQLSTLL